MACVPDRVLRQVLGDDPQHARPERNLRVRIAVGGQLDSGARSGVVEARDHVLQRRKRRGVTERDDLAATLELRQEEDLVDQRAGVLDLDARLRDQPVDVRSRQVRRIEQREDPRERRSQLVGDGGGEAGAKLVEATVRGVHVRNILAPRYVILMTIHQSVTIPTPGTYRLPFYA